MVKLPFRTCYSIGSRSLVLAWRIKPLRGQVVTRNLLFDRLSIIRACLENKTPPWSSCHSRLAIQKALDYSCLPGEQNPFAVKLPLATCKNPLVVKLSLNRCLLSIFYDCLKSVRRRSIIPDCVKSVHRRSIIHDCLKPVRRRSIIHDCILSDTRLSNRVY